MRDPEAFDAFYAEARGRLLLQTYALTGDLPASRDAVRSAFVAAWHHWKKVSRHGDPEAWVRPEAWRRARRRHQARPWHREKVLDEEDRRTLEALEELSVRQRKTLLLTQLSTVTTQEMAREVGVPLGVATEQLQEATSQLCLALEIVPAEIRPRLESLAEQLSGARFFRPTLIRRAGAIRRRAHTLVGVVASVLLVLGVGAVVHNGDSEAPMLGQVDEEVEPRLRTADLLGPKEVGEALAPRRARGPGNVDNNTEDTGIYAPCQAQPFAVESDDPAEGQTLVRRMKLSGKQKGRTIQSVEVAPDARSGHAAFERMQEWFVACNTARAQLLSVHELDGVGDEGKLFTLRTWNAPVTTHQAAVVRSGRLVSLVLLQTRDRESPGTGPMLTLAGNAVDRLCRAPVGTDARGACAAAPKARRVPPPRPDEAVGMLQVFDLPPVRGVEEPWVGVKPVRATENLAATRCDNTDFTGKRMKRARTRTFVILEAKLPKEFGITETTGRLTNKKRARGFVDGVRSRVAGCTDDDLTVTVNRLGNHAGGDEEITWWRIDTEVTDTRTLTQYMAVARRGRTVAQVGFTPGARGKKTLAEDDFDALAVRAAKRLGNMSNP